MDDDEYQAMLNRLSAMREKSRAKKAARLAPAPEYVQTEPIHVAEPEPEPIEPAPTPELSEITPELPPPKKTASKPRAIKNQVPKPNILDENELDKYFSAKYKWKSAYATPAPPPVFSPPPMATAVRATAQDQIRSRVNDEVMKMAMKSVFPDWH
jgi:hypothetical protein